LDDNVPLASEFLPIALIVDFNFIFSAYLTSFGQIETFRNETFLFGHGYTKGLAALNTPDYFFFHLSFPFTLI